MRPLAILCLWIMPLSALSQNYCGFDFIRDLDSHAHIHEAAINEIIYDRLTSGLELRAADEIYTVPVVVHVVHNNGPENISNEQILTAIQHLNEAFANTGSFDFDLGFDTGIQFCLASRDPDDNFTSGINRIVSAEFTDLLVPSEDFDLKSLSNWNSTEYLNIWVVQEITRELNNSGTVGYATFPDSHGLVEDGIVCEAALFGSDPIGSSVHIHECGHYLGLYHTFENGCPNDDCLASGDQVCDTPPDTHLFNTICNDNTNSCLTDDDDLSENNPFRPIGSGGLGYQVDDQTNFMDYSGLVCFQHFTIGQSERMAAVLLEFRSSLLDSFGCYAPCANEITLAATSSAAEAFVNESITFTSTSIGQDNTEWYLDGVLASTDDSYDQLFIETGEHIVTLELSNNEEGCAQILDFVIQVLCPANALFDSPQTSLATGETITFSNQSTGSTQFEWYINGFLIGENLNLDFTFSEPGGQSIQLFAFAEGCVSESETLFLEVGSCSNGNEVNYWHFLNQGGSLFGLNFNNSPSTPITPNPLTEEFGHCNSTMCDAAGNLLWVSTGEQILDSNYDPLPNGTGLLGHISSHYGTMFVQVPGSETLYYCFTSDASENSFANGLRYSIIDLTLNDGLGDVTQEKNILIHVSLTEAFTAVRHCNLNDFWLVSYDQAIDQYVSFLVTSEGVSEAIFSAVNNPSIFYTTAIANSPDGSMLAHGSLILNIDNSTGEISIALDTQDSSPLGSEFSPSGNYLYWLTGDLFTEIIQLDLTLEPSEWFTDPYSLELAGSPILFYPQLAPDGKIYLENVLTNQITIINEPNLEGDNTLVEQDAFSVGSLVNSFGNYYQGYINGRSVFINGIPEPCPDSFVLYEVDGFECITDDISWQIPEEIAFNQLSAGQIELSFPAEGQYAIGVTVHSDCGNWTGSMEVETTTIPALDLGDDAVLCTGESIVLIPSSDFDSYIWQDGSDGSTFTVSEIGNYSVSTTIGNCELQDDIQIIPPPAGINLGPDFDVCDSTITVLNIDNEWLDPIWQDGSTGPSYTVYEGGSYSVTTNLPCLSFDEVYVDPCHLEVVDVTEEGTEFGLVIYPNPATNQVSVTINSSNNDQLQLRLIDSLGRTVWQSQETLVRGINSISIDVAKLARENYILELLTTDKVVQKPVLLR
jgi:hypothetical protein